MKPMIRILLVDDDDLFRQMLHTTLKRFGYDVVAARNGNEALALHQREPFDLIMTDLIMPEKEGLETIRDLRRQKPDMKIIAMSGGARTIVGDHLKMAKAMGAAQVLAKPFSNQEMMEAIEATLGKAQ